MKLGVYQTRDGRFVVINKKYQTSYRLFFRGDLNGEETAWRSDGAYSQYDVSGKDLLLDTWKPLPSSKIVKLLKYCVNALGKTI